MKDDLMEADDGAVFAAHQPPAKEGDSTAFSNPVYDVSQSESSELIGNELLPEEQADVEHVYEKVDLGD